MDKTSSKFSSLDSKDGSYISTLHLSRALVGQIHNSMLNVTKNLLSGERLWCICLQTSWPSQRLPGRARPQGGEGEEARLREGLGDRPHADDHHAMPLPPVPLVDLVKDQQSSYVRQASNPASPFGFSEGLSNPLSLRLSVVKLVKKNGKSLILENDIIMRILDKNKQK